MIINNNSNHCSPDLIQLWSIVSELHKLEFIKISNEGYETID